MSEEEKEAIEYIKAFQKDLYGASEKNLMAIYIDRVWNYIDKLQKENEELKERNKGLTTAIEEWVNGERINDIKHISKDKIRDKIKELEENLTQTYGILGESLTTPAIKILKELLEEQ